jgi:hypothetical protein
MRLKCVKQLEYISTYTVYGAAKIVIQLLLLLRGFLKQVIDIFTVCLYRTLSRIDALPMYR